MYGLPDSIGGYYAKKLIKKQKYMMRGAPARGTAFGFKLVNITIDKAALHMVLNTPSGNLWGAMEKRGNAIVRDAKKKVGVKTGALRSSIHKRHLGNATGQYLWIGSKLNYAYAHHEGTRPHTITPSKAPLLVFRSGARVIKTTAVKHPGTRPNPYLTAAMRQNLVRPIIVR
jgi:hypothetical protein